MSIGHYGSERLKPTGTGGAERRMRSIRESPSCLAKHKNPLVGFFGFLITKNACTIRFQITCMRLMVHFDFVRLLFLNDRYFFHDLRGERLVSSVSVLVYDAVSYIHSFDDLAE